MNSKHYQSLTRILNKVLHRISLCLNKSTIEEASVEWKYDEYNISIQFEHENSSTFIAADGAGSDYKKAAKSFIKSLVNEIKRVYWSSPTGHFL